MTGSVHPFVGSEAVARGVVSRHQLRTRHHAVFPDVYLPNGTPPSLRNRIAAACLWAHGETTIAGLSAAALLGAKWIDDDIAVELINANPRPLQGTTTRRDVLPHNEVRLIDGRRVTTPARTAFDLARRGNLDQPIARLDALCRATGLDVSDVSALARRHRRARGLRQLETALALVDSGAESPQETRIRLLLIRDGLPVPRTQIPVLDCDGRPFAYLDMGWEDCMVAVEYEGAHHQTDRWTYKKDIIRAEKVAHRGWDVVKVVKEDHPLDVLRRVRAARARRTTSVQSGR